MGNAVDVKVDMKVLLKKMKKLPDRVQKNVITGAIRAGATLIAKEAKNKVPMRTGLLKKSIGVVKVKRDSKNPTIVKFSVAPRSSYLYKKQKKHYNYGRLVEFGKKGQTAHPYMRPAFETKGPEAIKATEKYMASRIDKELAKL